MKRSYASPRWLMIMGIGVIQMAVGSCSATLPPVPQDVPGNYVVLTKPLIALSDTQEHEATGFPLHNNTGGVDAYVEVAQRPPEQPLFGRRIVEWVLERHPTEPVIHLGDLLDLSCQSELSRMRHTFSTAQQQTVILPGNHDGLLFGIFNYDLVTDYLTEQALQWHRGCRPGADPSAPSTHADGRGSGLNKHEYLAAYIASLNMRHSPAMAQPSYKRSGHHSVSWRNSDPEQFLQRLEGQLVSGRDYARSFLVQKLALPPENPSSRRVTIIGMDTNQLAIMIGIWNLLQGLSPGDTGRILDEQVRRVEMFVNEAQQANEIVVLAGHHNWEKLSVQSQERLANILVRLDHPLIYLSGHTHTGFWAVHQVAGRPLLELNISSLSDWPIAYRRLTFAHDQARNRLKVVGQLLPSEGTAPQNDVDLLNAWMTLTCQKSMIPSGRLDIEDLELVKDQKASRGTLTEWLIDGLGEWCDSCRLGLYEHGHRYQNEMLITLDELFSDLGAHVDDLHAVRTPAFCADRTVQACITYLLESPIHNLDASRALFRDKAQLVHEVKGQLDAIEDPVLKNYTTCRAVSAAKDDYDLTPDEQRQGQDERSRQTRAFFRFEATVGMGEPI